MKTRIKYALIALVVSVGLFLVVNAYEKSIADQQSVSQTCFRELEKKLQYNCPGVFKDAVVLDTARYWVNKLHTDCRIEKKTIKTIK